MIYPVFFCDVDTKTRYDEVFANPEPSFLRSFFGHHEVPVAGHWMRVTPTFEDRLREAIPDIYLLTDVICGYPTETEEAAETP